MDSKNDFGIDLDVWASWGVEFQEIVKEAFHMAEYQKNAELPMIPLHHTVWFTNGRYSVCGLDLSVNPSFEVLRDTGPNYKYATLIPAGREFCRECQ